MRLLLIIIVTSTLFMGCSSTTELDIWPIVYYEKDEETQSTQLDLLTSIYSYSSTPEQESHAFRPFFVGEFAKDREFMQMLFAWPLVYYRKEPNDSLIWVLPAYYYRDIKRVELGERDFDWFFLPFFAFGGTDTKEGPYMYLSFWGNIKGLLGYDEIAAYPFPFYVTSRKGEYKTWAYMWPLFRFGEGDRRKFEFYCFMYSSYELEGKFRRKSYLWPLIHYNEENLHKKHPNTEFLFWPFYGQSTSDVSLTWTVLWHLFSYSSHENGYREYNMPWPIFKYRTGQNTEEFRILPFYWKTDKKIGDAVEDDLVIMWPIFWHSYSNYPTYEKNSLYVIPFYWSHWRKGKEKGAKSTKRLKIWPVYEYRQEEDGSTRSRVLSPLWFEDYFPYGIEKAWVPFFTLFDYNTGAQSEKSVTVLGPLYHYKEKENYLYHRFLMFSYKNRVKIEKEKERDKGRFSFLGGLFEYRWDGGESGLRFFYLPQWPSWGTK